MDPVVVMLSGPELSAAFQGFAPDRRLLSIAAFGPSSEAEYAAVFAPGAGPPQSLHVDLPTQAALDAVLSLRAADGFYPTQLTGTLDAAGKRFALVCQPRSDSAAPDFMAPFVGVVRLEKLWEKLDDADGADANVLAADYLGSDSFGAMWVAILADNHAKRRDHYAAHDLTPVGYPLTEHPTYEAMQTGWCRPFSAVPYAPPSHHDAATRRILTLWRTDTFVPWPPGMTGFTGGVTCEGPLTREQLNALWPTLPSSGRWPHAVGASGAGDAARFCLLSVPVGMIKPLARKWTVRRLEAFTAGISPGMGGPFSFGERGARGGSRSPPFEAPREHLGPGGPGGAEPEPPEPPSTSLIEATAGLAGTLSPPDDPLLAHVKQLVSTGFPFTPGTPRLVGQGPRLVQLAVQRAGGLAYAVAATFAEDGYPAPLHRHQVRVGSVSKMLTAFALHRLFGPGGTAGTYDMPIGEARGIGSAGVNAGVIALPRLEELVRHRAGWGSTSPNTDFPTQFTYQDIVDVVGKAPEPGDLGVFLEETEIAIMPPNGPPFGTSAYTNYGFAALGEIVSRHLGLGPEDYKQYAERLTELFGYGADGEEVARMHLILDGWPESAVAGEPPCHLRRPGVLGNPQGPLPPYVPWQYGTGKSNRYQGGAGRWAISAVDLVRLGARLDPQSDLPQLLSAEQIEMFWTPYAPLFTNQTIDDGGGRGCYYYERTFATPSGQRDVRVLTHNGSVEGGAAYIVHVLPTSSLTPSLTIALTLNADVRLAPSPIPPQQSFFDPIIDACEDMEAQGGFSPNDLFDVY